MGRIPAQTPPPIFSGDLVWSVSSSSFIVMRWWHHLQTHWLGRRWNYKPFALLFCSVKGVSCRFRAGLGLEGLPSLVWQEEGRLCAWGWGRRCFWMDRVGRRTIRETAACLSHLKQTAWEHQAGTKTFGVLDNSHLEKELLAFFPAVVSSHSVVSWEVLRNLEIVSLSVRDHGFGVGVRGPRGLLPGAQLPRAIALQLQPARGAFQAAAR